MTTMSFEKPKPQKPELTPEEEAMLQRVRAQAPEEKPSEEQTNTGPEEAPRHKVLDAEDQKKRRDAVSNPHGFSELKE